MIAAPLALALAAALTPSQDSGSPPPQDFGDYHALVIGNDAYQHHRPLVTAVADAKAVAKLLREDYDFEVTELYDATRQKLEDALWAQAEKLDEGDNLLVYYAGHGYVDPLTNEGYWLGVDADSSPRRWVSNATITTALKAIPAKHVMVVSDSCFSGSLTRGISVERGRPDYHRKVSRLRTRVALTSGGLEPVSDEGRDGHSVFAYQFLQALRGNGGVLDGTSLYKAIERPVYLAADQKPDYGDIRKCGHDGGDFLFVRRRGAIADSSGSAVATPVDAPQRLVRGTIEQVSRQSARIRVEGQAVENLVFGTEDFVLPVTGDATRIVLVALVDGEERARRAVELGQTTRTERLGGREVPVHSIGAWAIPTLPLYVEGRLELPPGVRVARLAVDERLRRAEDFDASLHVLEREQGAGAFRLVLPDARGTTPLHLTAEGCDEQTLALPLDRAERAFRGTRRVRVLNLGALRLEATRVASSATLDVLLDRAAYAALDRSSVEGLVGLAQSKWRGELTGFEYTRVERFECGGSSHWMSVWKHGETGLEFVLVPGGRFQMGSPAGETDRDSDEKPHWVTLDPFLMARTECTQAAWAGVARRAGLNSDPSRFEGSSALPVETVSWEDVDKWCRAAKLKLPTEAQWEFACRAGTTTAFSMGNDASALARFGNCASAESSYDWKESWRDGYADETASAGSFGANAFGLLDMHGNVSEWCRDWYVDYDQPVPDRNGLRKGTSSYRVLRGGSFRRAAGFLRSASRDRLVPEISSWNLGFRPSQDLPF